MPHRHLCLEKITLKSYLNGFFTADRTSAQKQAACTHMYTARHLRYSFYKQSLINHYMNWNMGTMNRRMALVLSRLPSILTGLAPPSGSCAVNIAQCGTHRSHENVMNVLKRSFSDGSGRVTGLNILKQGQDPEEMKDEDVPDWLARLAEHGNGKSLLEMERKVEDCGIDGLGIPELKYLKKLQNRKRIKQSNSLRAK